VAETEIENYPDDERVQEWRLQAARCRSWSAETALDRVKSKNATRRQVERLREQREKAWRHQDAVVTESLGIAMGSPHPESPKSSLERRFNAADLTAEQRAKYAL
jgi:hypothetical protein